MNWQLTGIPGALPFRHRCAALVLAGLLLLSAAPALAATLDPEFAKLPFDRWLSGGRQSKFPWSVDIQPAELSTHQRLILRVVVRVDGRELEKRRGAGEFLSMVQYQNSSGERWQNHTALNLASMQPTMRGSEMDVTFYAFVLPGDYIVSVAVCDSHTLEHSAISRKVHVAALRTDPLPELWKGLPAVEIIPPVTDPPDVWYLPDIRHRLNLSLTTRRPLHIQVVVNTTPSQRAAGSLEAMRRNMSVLVPALKILSQIELRNGTVDAALLDLTHRRVSFEQRSLGSLAWEPIRRLFLDAKPGIVDVRTLEGQWKMQKFFWDDVTHRLDRPGEKAVQAVIVLSGPAFFENQEPVDPPAIGNDPDRRLFYIRYRAIPIDRRQRIRPHPGMRPLLPRPAEPMIPAMGMDDLERTVGPLHARLFDAASAEQFRRVLAAVIEQLQTY